MSEVSFLLSFSAGIIAFLSPCILPVIPSYITVITGISYKELNSGKYRKWKALGGSLAFVLGFSTVFVIMGIIFTTSGLLINNFFDAVNKIAGTLVIVLGINYVFDFIKFLNLEKRFHLRIESRNWGTAFVVGATFGAGWTPCIGPILSTILIIAGSSGNTFRGAALLAVFSLGLGLPFILTGLFFTQSGKVMNHLKKRLLLIKKMGGVFMVLIGVLIFRGDLLVFNGTLFRWASALERWSIAHPDVSFILPVLIILLFALGSGFKLVRNLRQRNGREVQDQYPTAGGQVRAGSILNLTFIVFLLMILILILTGVLNPYTIISGWMRFTGI
jgi:cytochrome c-type biogenesis protein